MNAKEEILEALNRLPADATIDDAMECLYLMMKVQRGIAQAKSGQGVTQDEAKERMKRWRKYIPSGTQRKPSNPVSTRAETVSRTP